MNAITKRLLSFAIVLAMVLSMTPAITFSAEAATTDSIDSWIEDFEEAEAAGDVSTITTCPFCEGTTVTWTAISGDKSAQTTAQTDTHFYLSGTINVTAAVRFFRTNVDGCLYLNDGVVNNTAGTNVFHAGGKTMTIFGDGTINSASSSAMFHYNAAGGIKIYGGTYNYTGSGVMFNNTQGANSTLGTHAMLYGGTFNVNVETYDEDKGTTAYNHVQIADGMEVTANGDGTWTVGAPAPEPELELPTSCACGAELTESDWTVLSGTSTEQISISASTHVYLSDDYSTSTAGSIFDMAASAGTLCIHLNGNTLSCTGAGRIVNARNNTVNIYDDSEAGTGAVTNSSTSSYDMFRFNSGGTANVYGGTYTNNGSGKIFEDDSTAYVTLHGGTYNENPEDYSAVNLTIADGMVVTENSEDGTWTVEEEPPLVLPTECPYCNATGLTESDWTMLSGTSSDQLSITADTHIWMDGNYTSSKAGAAIHLGNSSQKPTVCLYLNGKKLEHTATTGSMINARYGTLNIIDEVGGGEVVNAAGNESAMFAYNGTGSVNIYGGDFTCNGTTIFTDVSLTDDTKEAHVVFYGGSINKDLSTLTGFTYSKNVKAKGVSVINAGRETIYAEAADALAAYEGGYIRANEDAALEITGETYIDAAGNAVTVTGSGTLYAMDNSGDDYTTGGKFMIADTVQVVRDVTGGANGYRYISLNHGSVADSDLKYLKAHRLDMKLKTVSLRPAIEDNAGQMGLYYKAQISCGADLGSALGTEDNCYGVVVSLQDMPGADFATEINPDNNKNRNGFTEIKGGLSVSEANSWTVTLNSGSVFGIMTASEAVLADESLQALNATYGKMPIYANAYLYIDFDGEGDYDADEFIMGDTANGGKNTETMDSNGVAWSLYDVLYTIDTKWTNFEAAHESINAFYTYWYPYGMNDWSFTNITKNS